MNARTATRILGTIFAVVAIFLVGLALFPRPTAPEAVVEPSVPPGPPDKLQRQVVTSRPRKTRPSAEIPVTEISIQNQSDVPLESAQPAAPDPDEEFLKGIASHPLDQANLEVRLEVERRIKDGEKQRAKLIFSEEKNNTVTVAYAVKQPSAQEVAEMLKLYQTFLNLQTNQQGREYVDQRFQYLVDVFNLTEGKYRLLYATIPQAAGGITVYTYSYPASTEQECMNILKQELAPRAPMVIGVPYTSRHGQYSLYRDLKIGWRMDHLVSEDLTKSFRPVHP